MPRDEEFTVQGWVTILDEITGHIFFQKEARFLYCQKEETWGFDLDEHILAGFVVPANVQFLVRFLAKGNSLYAGPFLSTGGSIDIAGWRANLGPAAPIYFYENTHAKK